MVSKDVLLNANEIGKQGPISDHLWISIDVE
jgi:hypothetical protein